MRGTRDQQLYCAAMLGTRRPVVLNACVGVLVCLGLAGCGGSSKPVPLGPSKASYIKRVDALCKAQARAHPKDYVYATGSDGSEVPNMSRASFDLTRKELSEVRALPEPRADRKLLAAIWAARGAQLSNARGWYSIWFAYLQRDAAGKPPPDAATAAVAEKRAHRFFYASYNAATRYQTLAIQFGIAACTLVQPGA